MFKRTKSNPYEFVRMVKWHSKDKNFEGYVGYTKDGDIYLTWDVRKDIPIFFPNCKIGIDLKLEDFKKFEELYYTLDGRWIEEIHEKEYEIYRGKESCFFKRQDYNVPKEKSIVKLSFKPIFNF